MILFIVVKNISFGNLMEKNVGNNYLLSGIISDDLYSQWRDNLSSMLIAKGYNIFELEMFKELGKFRVSNDQ